MLDDMVSERIARYQIVRRLGAGGMGEVFLAQDPELERPVALKVMSAALAQDENQRKRFRAEARAASGLVHPHVCVILEVGETKDGRPFIAMEYVEGQTLDRVLQQRPLKMREAIQIGIQVADALDSAHARGIVHRDIKTANIMLDRRGRVKVLDFGLAKRFAQDELSTTTTSLADTRTGVLLGTPYYMSPEQVLGREVDQRSDLFSLGVVLYEMLVGQRPFLGRTVGEAINNVVNQTPSPLGIVSPPNAPALDGIVLKCLEKDPARRYASARELEDDLIKVRNLTDQAETLATSTPTPTGALTDEAGASAAGSDQPEAKRSGKGLRRDLVVAGAFLGLVLLITVAVWFHSERRLGQEVSIGRVTISAAPPPNSVAVLPFDNFSGDPETDYLSDGLTEEITTALSRIHGLKVAARNSAFTFKGKKMDARQIGAALRVGTLLEGSIRKVGNQIRVTAQLINALDGFHLWSETYDRPADDFIAVQEEIARRISERLQGKPESPVVAHSSVSPEAHKSYMQARFFWNQRTEAGLKRALELFRAAAEKAPSFSEAQAGLASTYYLLPLYSVDFDHQEYRRLARAAANRALELDTTCVEAHAVLGNLQAEAHDYRGAEQHFQRAIAVNPNYATAHQWYGGYLNMHGHRDQGLLELQKAIDLDPLSPILRATIPGWYYAGRDYDRAILEAKKVLQAFPDFPPARSVLVGAYLMKQQYREALAEIDQARALQPDDPLAFLEHRGFALARLGQTNESQSILALLETHRRQGKRVDGAIGTIYLGLRDYNKAIDAFEAMVAVEGWSDDIMVDPFFDELRATPRCQEWLKKAGINPTAGS